MSTDADPRIRRTLPTGRPAPRSAAWYRRLAGDRAEERAYRTLAFGFLPGAVLFGLLAAPDAAAQVDAWPAWWTAAAYLAGVAPSLVLGATAFLLPVAVLRRIALVAMVAVLAALSAIPLLVRPGHVVDGQAWFLQVCGLGLIAAALAVRPGAAVLVQLLGGALLVMDRHATDRTPDALLQGTEDGLYTVLFVLTFLALGVSALAAARAADEEEVRAAEAASAAAADRARDRERSRVNALVHDRVLATLLAAARPVPGADALRRTDASRALAGLRRLLHDDGSPADVPADALVWQVQAVATELLPEAGFGYEVTAGPPVPGEVAEALLEATAEALRNSRRHAGTANRTVHVVGDAAGLRIDVLDDGAGFDRAAVPPTRLGVAESIEGRMGAVTGGTAAVVSQPGVGTRVLLGWTAP